jgi:CDP-diacylglycerol---serine O-phosphatidyltransferase
MVNGRDGDVAAMAKPQTTRYTIDMRNSAFDRYRERYRPDASLRRFKLIPVRTLVPNLITLLALCAGLTAIRLAVEEKLEWAVAAIVFAALLDGIDGRVARMLKGTSRFGAELDSLADFVNFGVAPALILYFWSLHELGNAGWIAAMVLAISTGLRLARFNVMIDDPNKPLWAGNFFTGMPAPAGAITALLPLYVYFLGMPRLAFVAPVTLIYTLAIAFLMVSRLPVFSGKRVGKRIAPEMVPLASVGVVLFFALLISYPWPVLTVGTVLYLLSLPVGPYSYREYQRKDAAAAAQAAAPSDTQPRAPAELPPPATQPRQGPEPPTADHTPDPDRPARLN